MKMLYNEIAQLNMSIVLLFYGASNVSHPAIMQFLQTLKFVPFSLLPFQKLVCCKCGGIDRCAANTHNTTNSTTN